MANLWTEQEINILREKYLSLTDQELYYLIPRHSTKAIQSKRVELELIKPKTRKKYSYDDFERLMGEKEYQIVSAPSEYQNAGTIMKYICPYHNDVGVQKITLGRLLEGKGCIYCGRERTIKARTKPITKRMINEAQQICNDKSWTYVSIERDINNQGKSGIFVKFLCNHHLEYGTQKVTWANFKRNQKCKYCQHKDLSKEDISDMAKQGSPYIQILSEYSKINDAVEYVCTKHNCFNKTKIRNIIAGSACYQCGIEKLAKFHFISDEEIDKRIEMLNPNVQRVSKYNGIQLPMTYKCSKCNHEWTGLLHSSNHCPNCERQLFSWGERYVSEILNEQHIDYETQKKFDKCKNVRVLPFDFYLPKYNICIEYQGKQHFEPCDYFGGEESLDRQRHNDDIKREFCKSNKIGLIEIPYMYNTKDKIKAYISEQINVI